MGRVVSEKQNAFTSFACDFKMAAATKSTTTSRKVNDNDLFILFIYLLINHCLYTAKIHQVQ